MAYTPNIFIQQPHLKEVHTFSLLSHKHIKAFLKATPIKAWNASMHIIVYYCNVNVHNTCL